VDLSPYDWLAVVERDYLRDYVREGGAAVKFVVPASALGRLEVRDRLREAAERNDFQFAFVDAAAVRLHLIDRLFQEVARQVDWTDLAESFLRRLLGERGIALPPTGEALRLPVLAERNDYPEPLFRNEVKGWLTKQIFRDYEMVQEFRLAMLQLCWGQLDPEEDPALTPAVLDWLRGELRLISTLKRALIFQKIGRHNARAMLYSLAHWLAAAGKSGLVLGLDISRYAESPRAGDRGEGLYYSTTAAMDAYEVLRQLIDGTDELTYCFIGVVAGAEFLSDDRRGLRSYHALYLRISDEVRDRYRQNPHSALVRLGEE
jgi:hypothetical protein